MTFQGRKHYLFIQYLPLSFHAVKGKRASQNYLAYCVKSPFTPIVIPGLTPESREKESFRRKPESRLFEVFWMAPYQVRGD